MVQKLVSTRARVLPTLNIDHQIATILEMVSTRARVLPTLNFH